MYYKPTPYIKGFFWFVCIISFSISVFKCSNVCMHLCPLQQVKQAGPQHPSASAEHQLQESASLRAELEKMRVQHEAELCSRETQHSTELKNLRKEFHDAEAQHLTLQKEILMLKDKLEKIRRERFEMCIFMSAGLAGSFVIRICKFGSVDGCFFKRYRLA